MERIRERGCVSKGAELRQRWSGAEKYKVQLSLLQALVAVLTPAACCETTHGKQGAAVAHWWPLKSHNMLYILIHIRHSFCPANERNSPKKSYWLGYASQHKVSSHCQVSFRACKGWERGRDGRGGGRTPAVEHWSHNPPTVGSSLEITPQLRDRYILHVRGDQ